MRENAKAKLYLDRLDKVLAGNNDLMDVEDVEVKSLLKLARKMILVDVSIKSEVKELLRQRLLNILSMQDSKVINFAVSDRRQEDTDELSEEELSLAAAGMAVNPGNSKCSLYACCPYNKSCNDCFMGIT